MTAPAAFLSPRAAGILLSQADAARRRPQRLQPQQRYPNPSGTGGCPGRTRPRPPSSSPGGNSITGYTVDVYANGLDAAATGSWNHGCAERRLYRHRSHRNPDVGAAKPVPSSGGRNMSWRKTPIVHASATYGVWVNERCASPLSLA